MDRFKDAYGVGSGTTYDRTVIRGLADGTLLVYGQRVARHQPAPPPRALIQHRLLEIFGTNSSTSGIKAVLSAVRLLEKLGWIKEVVTRADWLLVEAMDHHVDRCHRAPDKSWASIVAISQLAALARGFGDWEVVELAAVPSGLLLRASEESLLAPPLVRPVVKPVQGADRQKSGRPALTSE